MHVGRALGLTLLFLLSTAAAQQKPQGRPVLPSPGASREEAAAVAQFWVQIAEGKAADVAPRARQLLDQYPRSAAVLAVVIETDIVAGSAHRALVTYDAWLRGRSLEEPLILRRIARALLFEFGRQDADPLARSEALLALVDDGETIARDMLAKMAQSGGETGLRSGSRLQDPNAIAQIAQRMSTTKGDKSRDIELLAATNSPLAVPPLIATLADPEPRHRMLAANALGDFSGPNVANALLPLLNDQNPNVRTAAAGALLKQGNFAGLTLLEDLASRPEVSFRRAAARLLAPRPDDRWMGLVRGLLVEHDAMARLEAAELIAPHDVAAARQTLMELSNDPNPAVREEAELARAGLPTATLTELRGLMRDGKGRARVRAASRVLEMTR